MVNTCYLQSILQLYCSEACQKEYTSNSIQSDCEHLQLCTNPDIPVNSLANTAQARVSHTENFTAEANQLNIKPQLKSQDEGAVLASNSSEQQSSRQ